MTLRGYCQIFAEMNIINCWMRKPITRGVLPIAFSLVVIGLLRTVVITHAPESITSTGPTNEISDSQIMDVLRRVARRQLIPLQVGNWPDVSSNNTSAFLASVTPPQGIAWYYSHGVMLYGLLLSTDVTHDESVSRFVIRHNKICAHEYEWSEQILNQAKELHSATNIFHKSAIAGLLRLGDLDSCGAMGTALLETIRRYPQDITTGEKSVLARIAEWVTKKQERLPDGTFWRAKQLGGTVWPDDLYMGGVFLVHYGLYTGDQKFIDDAANQIIHQAALEQDEDGLWFHGYFVGEKKHAPFKWGRGNGWVMVALVETLSALPETHPLRPQLLDILRKQIEGLKKVQAPDGMWCQVLDQPDLWEETSCTAMFAYGIARAVNRGWIDSTNMAIARRAFSGVVKNITFEGAVSGTCQGTSINRDLDYYANRSRPADDPHGSGPVLLAGTEIISVAVK